MGLELTKTVGKVAEAVPKTLTEMRKMFSGISRWSDAKAESYTTKKMMEDLASIYEMGTETGLPQGLINVLRADAIRRHTKLENFDAVLELAAGMDVDTKRIGEVPEDWKDEFQGQAEEAYDNETRATWASILAGEINEPGTYSKRMLRVLSEISSREASSFVRMCRYAITPMVFSQEPSVAYDPIFVLEDEHNGGFNGGRVSLIDRGTCASLGLVDDRLMTTRRFIPGTVFPFKVGDRVAMVSNPSSDMVSVNFSGAIMLPLGKELSRLCELGTANDLPSIIEKKLASNGLSVQWGN